MRTIHLIAFLALKGCLAAQRIDAPTLQPDSQHAIVALNEEAEAQWFGRSDVANLKAAISLYESIIRIDPRNTHARARLLRGLFFLADALTTDEAERRNLYERIRNLGQRCLARQPIAHTGIPAPPQIPAELLVPCWYWTAMALLRLGEMDGPAARLAALEDGTPLIAKVIEVEPGFYYGGPHRYMGYALTRLPSFAGRDLAMAREHYERAIRAWPDFLQNRVDLAGIWAVAVGDRELFKDQLERVLAADLNTLPDLVPEQLAAQREASRLLEREEDLFNQ